MQHSHLSRKDLNLLVIFDVVAECRSVNRAAERLQLTPSALSHALGRLRRMFDDALFVRGRTGLQPTPKAESLKGPIRQLLRDANALLAPAGFDPLSCDATMRIAMTESALLILGGPLVHRARRRAPGLHLDLLALGPTDWPTRDEQLALGIVDGPAPPQVRHTRKLLSDRYIGAIHAAHPLAGRAAAGPISIEEYAAFPHFQALSPRQRQPHLHDLPGAGNADRVASINTTSFTANFPILIGTEAIATVPCNLARVACQSYPNLVVFELPVSIPPVQYWMAWDERTHDDAASRWLRDLVEETSGAIERSAALPGIARS